MERIQRDENSLARVASPVPPLEGVLPGTTDEVVQRDAEAAVGDASKHADRRHGMPKEGGEFVS